MDLVKQRPLKIDTKFKTVTYVNKKRLFYNYREVVKI
jgi:hypothetical protein